MWGYYTDFVILVGFTLTFGQSQDVFYPFGPDVGDETLHKNDDGYSPEQSISMGFPFFNRTFQSLFVSLKIGRFKKSKLKKRWA